MYKIPATIITGFLGAGKTTLISQLVKNYHNKNFAFIINEFGDIGLDRDMMLGCGNENCRQEDIIELANGCICCAVADDFLPAMEKILARQPQPDHIIIETSGLALPKPLVKAFAWQGIATKVTVDAVITLVDAPAIHQGYLAADMEALQKQQDMDDSRDHDDPIEEVFEDQLLCADMILLNKADLCTDTMLENIKKTIKPHCRQQAILFPISLIDDGKENKSLEHIFGLEKAAEKDLDTRLSHHDSDEEHDHDDFDSFDICWSTITDIDSFVNIVESLCKEHDIVRIKGFLNIENKPMRMVFHMAGGRINYYFDQHWKDIDSKDKEVNYHGSRLIVIGLHGLDRDTITNAIIHTKCK